MAGRVNVEAMPEDRFWTLIEQSLPLNEDQAKRLTAVLETLPCEEKQAFYLRFNEVHRAAYRWDIWAAAYLYGGGCSDDAFMDFRCGLIGLGRQAYEAVLRHPDDLVEYVQEQPEETLFHEQFGYVPFLVLKDSGCPEPPLNEILAAPRNADGDAPEWDFDDEAEMQQRFPRLSEFVEAHP